MPGPRVQHRAHSRWKHTSYEAVQLLVEAAVGLALVAAARFQRAAQRTDRAGIGRAHRDVAAFECVLTDAAFQFRLVREPLRRSREVVLAVRGNGDEGRGDEGGEQRDERREYLGVLAEHAHEGETGEQYRDRQRTHAHGVDVVQVRALEFDVFGRVAQRLVDHEIGGERAYPPGGEIGVDHQDALDGAEDADLHEDQRQHHVEHQPHHAARVRMGEPREEVRPGDGAGVGVRHVDLELADDDENAREHQREGGRLEHLRECMVVHDGGFVGLRGVHALAHQPDRQERAHQ